MTISTEINTDINDTKPVFFNVSNTILHVTFEEFNFICIDNPDLRLELTKDNELIVMPPTDGENGKRKRNIELTI